MKFDELMAVLKLLMVLEFDKRKQIFILIWKEPGLRYKEIKSKTGWDSNYVNSNLMVLRNNGIVISKDGYYLTEVGEQIVTVLKNMKNEFATNELLVLMKKAKLI